MTDLTTVRLLRGYRPKDGARKLPVGAVLELPTDEASTLIVKGIAEKGRRDDFSVVRYDTNGIPHHLKDRLEIDVNALVEYRAMHHSDATRRIYEEDFKRFASWCEENDEPALPTTPETLSRYLLARARSGREFSTLCRDASAISHIHALTHKPLNRDELVSRTLQYLKREYYHARNEFEAQQGGIMGAMAKSALKRAQHVAG